jgi:hypothetical protein
MTVSYVGLNYSQGGGALSFSYTPSWNPYQHVFLFALTRGYTAVPNVTWAGYSTAGKSVVIQQGDMQLYVSYVTVWGGGSKTIAMDDVGDYNWLACFEFQGAKSLRGISHSVGASGNPSVNPHNAVTGCYGLSVFGFQHDQANYNDVALSYGSRILRRAVDNVGTLVVSRRANWGIETFTPDFENNYVGYSVILHPDEMTEDLYAMPL